MSICTKVAPVRSFGLGHAALSGAIVPAGHDLEEAEADDRFSEDERRRAAAILEAGRLCRKNATLAGKERQCSKMFAKDTSLRPPFREFTANPHPTIANHALLVFVHVTSDRMVAAALVVLGSM